MSAIHRSSWDSPRPFFGFEVLGRFLAPSHQYLQALRSLNQFATGAEARATPQSLSRYLQQPHKEALLSWNEYRWEGDLTVIDNREAYQQISVRSSSEAPWVSVRWMLVRVEPTDYPHSQWMIDAVFVSEPDETPPLPTSGSAAAAAWSSTLAPLVSAPLDEREQRRLFDAFDIDGSGTISRQEFRTVVADLGLLVSSGELANIMRDADADESGELDFDEFGALLRSAVDGGSSAAGRFATTLSSEARTMYTERPRDVVETLMRALRHVDEPYPFRGAEVAVRYCSPTNKASQLTPQAFASYLKEPWYEILTEWDEMEFESDDDAATLSESVAEEDVLVRRKGDPSWSVVNWQLSRHNGRWLTDSLSIN